MKSPMQGHALTLIHVKRIGLAVVLAFALAACTSASPGNGGTPLNVAGLWSGTATIDGECTDCGIVFDLEQNGSTVTGTSTDAFNDVTIDVSGTIDGNQLTLTHVGSGGNTIVHEGEVDGDTITGTIEGVNATGTVLSGTFVATRGVVDVSGSWSGTANTDDCVDCAITFDLAQAGTTVTGTSTDQVNDVTIDVQGTIIGPDLTLTHVTSGGNSIDFEGEVDGDAITGTIAGVSGPGTVLDGTFAVTRD